ncbi:MULTISPECIES: MmcQ/YjbR family DNA-binding protein [unclassified Flavobacterium]|uniref:MmcQ/YjbR family DNA-binding protein n=1 Tax=unclassified Flavobacterium TaxID=196869 RepID=UPI002639D5AE|nr:MmcQ/YjbR family DNA-binding protein [Flavobacterium sp.]
MNIEALQILCTSFPAVTEDIKWGNDLCFLIANKMFCVIGLDSTPLTVSFKTTEEDFDQLIARPHIKPAPYMARYKWVLVEDSSVLTPKEWEHYIAQSYQLIKGKLPAKIQASL